MSNAYRPIVNPYRETVQQGLTVNTADYTVPYHNYRPVLGVVLSVYTADDPLNPSALVCSDQRGYGAMAKVLVIQSGSSSMQILENVVITPDTHAGLDNYYESLPTPTTALIDGTPFDEQLFSVDPMLLNGDRCVVGWLAGMSDLPFILRWWPHQRNTVDPQTSGQGNPNSSGQGTTLNQRGRYYRRVNGVEQIITSRGDVYLSTALANSTVQPAEGVVDGRMARQAREGGGSIKAWIKQSQSLELDWNAPSAGTGVNNTLDPSLPQRNTPVGRAAPSDPTSTSVRMTQSSIEMTVPELVRVTSSEDVAVRSMGTTTFDADVDILVSASNSLEFTCSTLEATCSSSATITTPGQLSTTATDTSMTSTATFGVFSPAIQLSGTVQLGPVPTSGVYLSTPINAVLAGVTTTLNAPAFDTLPDSAKIAALKSALVTVISAFTSNVSPVVFV